MRFYAAEVYEPKIDHRAYNKWFVIAFDSRTARDEWVRKQDTLTARAIMRREATAYAGLGGVGPEPFASQFWAIDMKAEYNPQWKGAPGFIGLLTVAYAPLPRYQPL